MDKHETKIVDGIIADILGLRVTVLAIAVQLARVSGREPADWSKAFIASLHQALDEH